MIMMRILKQILFTTLILFGASLATFAQKDDQRRRPPKPEPPVIVVPDKKSDKNNNPDRDKPRDDKRGKGKRDNDESSFVNLETFITLTD